MFQYISEAVLELPFLSSISDDTHEIDEGNNGLRERWLRQLSAVGIKKAHRSQRYDGMGSVRVK